MTVPGTNGHAAVRPEAPVEAAPDPSRLGEALTMLARDMEHEAKALVKEIMRLAQREVDLDAEVRELRARNAEMETRLDAAKTMMRGFLEKT